MPIGPAALVEPRSSTGPAASVEPGTTGTASPRASTADQVDGHSIWVDRGPAEGVVDRDRAERRWRPDADGRVDQVELVVVAEPHGRPAPVAAGRVGDQQVDEDGGPCRRRSSRWPAGPWPAACGPSRSASFSARWRLCWSVSNSRTRLRPRWPAGRRRTGAPRRRSGRSSRARSCRRRGRRASGRRAASGRRRPTAARCRGARARRREWSRGRSTTNGCWLARTRPSMPSPARMPRSSDSSSLSPVAARATRESVTLLVGQQEGHRVDVEGVLHGDDRLAGGGRRATGSSACSRPPAPGPATSERTACRLPRRRARWRAVRRRRRTSAGWVGTPQRRRPSGCAVGAPDGSGNARVHPCQGLGRSGAKSPLPFVLGRPNMSSMGLGLAKRTSPNGWRARPRCAGSSGSGSPSRAHPCGPRRSASATACRRAAVSRWPWPPTWPARVSPLSVRTIDGDRVPNGDQSQAAQW